MQLEGATALVTGANRGLGRHIAQELRDRGARVYGGARNPASVDLDDVIPLALDVTDAASVAAAADMAQGVSILVNNAGLATGADLLGGDLDEIRREFETNVFGTLAVTRAFAPQLAGHPKSYLVNILSVLSWVSAPHLAGYSASKSAQWSVTNGLRRQLAPNGTVVAGLHVGYMDTDMAASVTGDKVDPAEVARLVAEAIATDQTEIVVDELSRTVRAGLAGGVAALYPDVA